MLTSDRRHALFLFTRGLCALCLWLCACCWLVVKNHGIHLQYARAHVFRMFLYVCVCVCVTVYVCMLRALCITVCWRRAPRIGQAFACFLNPRCSRILILILWRGASKSSQTIHLSSQIRWSRSRCSFPDRTGRLPSRRSQRPRVL